MKIFFDIRGCMGKYGLKQRDLVAATGLKPATISNFTKGDAQPSLKSLMSMAANLNIPISDFFRYEMEEDETPAVGDLECPYCHHQLKVDVSLK